MSLTLSLKTFYAGVATDADSTPVVSDPSAAFGVRRLDTLEVVVAAGKAFTRDGTGLYSYPLDGSDADHPLALSGVTYEYWPNFTLRGVPANYQELRTEIGASGYYADSSDLEDWYGTKNIDIYSDLDDTGARDNARIQKWLTKADEKINLAFKRVGRTTPIPTNADDFSALSDIAAEWAGAMLAKGRGDLPERASNADAFDSLMDGHIERAEKALSDLVFLWSENESDTNAPSAAGAITAVVGAPKQYPGTGIVRPPTITVPSLTGNVSW